MRRETVSFGKKSNMTRGSLFYTQLLPGEMSTIGALRPTMMVNYYNIHNVLQLLPYYCMNEPLM